MSKPPRQLVGNMGLSSPLSPSSVPGLEKAFSAQPSARAAWRLHSPKNRLRGPELRNSGRELPPCLLSKFSRIQVHRLNLWKCRTRLRLDLFVAILRKTRGLISVES